MGKTTPYFLFVGENRADVKAALLEAGEATSLGNVGKALGLKWKALTDEQREEYKTRTQLLNVEAAEAEAEAAAVAEEAGETREEQGTQQADEKTIEKEDHLPIARVKRIINLDTDVKQVSKEATFLIACATEQLLGRLTEVAARFMRGKKRRTVTQTDVVSAARADSRMFFLVEHLHMPSPKKARPAPVAVAGEDGDTAVDGDAVAAAGAEAVAPASKKPKAKRGRPAGKDKTTTVSGEDAEAAPAVVRQITHFFGGKTKAPQPLAEAHNNVEAEGGVPPVVFAAQEMEA